MIRIAQPPKTVKMPCTSHTVHLRGRVMIARLGSRGQSVRLGMNSVQPGKGSAPVIEWRR